MRDKNLKGRVKKKLIKKNIMNCNNSKIKKVNIKKPVKIKMSKKINANDITWCSGC